MNRNLNSKICISSHLCPFSLFLLLLPILDRKFWLPENMSKTVINQITPHGAGPHQTAWLFFHLYFLFVQVDKSTVDIGILKISKLKRSNGKNSNGVITIQYNWLMTEFVILSRWWRWCRFILIIFATPEKKEGRSRLTLEVAHGDRILKRKRRKKGKVFWLITTNLKFSPPPYRLITK